MGLIIQPAKPPARAEMLFAPQHLQYKAEDKQHRLQCFTHEVLNEGLFFSCTWVDLRPAWAAPEWQKLPASVARGALYHSISVLCE